MDGSIGCIYFGCIVQYWIQYYYSLPPPRIISIQVELIVRSSHGDGCDATMHIIKKKKKKNQDDTQEEEEGEVDNVKIVRYTYKDFMNIINAASAAAAAASSGDDDNDDDGDDQGTATKLNNNIVNDEAVSKGEKKKNTEEEHAQELLMKTVSFRMVIRTCSQFLTSIVCFLPREVVR